MLGIPVSPNGDPLRKALVIAGNYSQFRHWCNFSQVNPHSRNVRYVFRPDDVRGYRDVDLVYTGRWHDRPGTGDLLDYLGVLFRRGEITSVYSQYESAYIEPNVIEGPPPVR